MARQPRFVLPGHAQHVIQRGNNRENIFNRNSDRYYYLKILLDACHKFECRIHAYVLMSNHVHLLITPDTETGISQVMQSLGRMYVQRFNFLYGRTGTLWEGRYKATLIDTEQYLFTCYRYIELNPVRAGITASPVDYPWSSYHCNALGKEDAMVSPHDLYLGLGDSKVTRQQTYRDLFDEHIDEKDLKVIRDSTNNAWVLGGKRFQARIKSSLERRTAPLGRGGDRKSKRFHAGKNINRV